MEGSPARGGNRGSPTVVFGVGLPHATKIFFERCFKNLDEESQATLSKITQTREELVLSLQRSSAAASIEAIKRYLPWILGLARAAENLPAEALSNFNSAWTSVLSPKYKSSPLGLNSLRWEILNISLVFGLLHRNLAGELLDKCTNENIQEEAKKIAHFLCCAAGIFDFIKNALLPTFGTRPQEPIPELCMEVYTALTWISLAEAQQMSLRVAVNAGMSEGALSKLSIELAQRYGTVNSMLSNLNGFSSDTLLPSLKAYVAFNEKLFFGITLKHLAAAAHKTGSYGQAVAYLQKAQREMPSEPSRAEPALVSFFRQYRDERVYIERLCETATNENDKIYYDPVPKEQSLVIPSEGKMLMKIVEMTPFEPATVNIVQTKAGECSIQ